MGVGPRGILKMKPLIRMEAKFNMKCKTHKSSYRNTYCMDCNTKPLCQKCNDENPAGPRHLGHKVIQVTKSTRKNSIKVKEIGKLIDGSDILQLVNNRIFVFMLITRGKPEEKQDAGKKKHCVKCGFPMQTTTEQPKARYCSIECKLEDVDVDLLPEMPVPDSCTATTDSETSSRKTVEDLLPGMPASSMTTDGSEASSTKTGSFRPTRKGPFCCGVKRIHRRKGHPHRAPLH